MALENAVIICDVDESIKYYEADLDLTGPFETMFVETLGDSKEIAHTKALKELRENSIEKGYNFIMIKERIQYRKSRKWNEAIEGYEEIHYTNLKGLAYTSKLRE